MDKLKIELETLTVGQAVTIAGKELTVKFYAIMHEMCQAAGSKEWVRNGKTSRAIALADGTWFFRVPKKEAGEYAWIMASQVEQSSSLREFYRGGDAPEAWGPARKFAKSGQMEKVQYERFGKVWLMTDIGTFDVAGQQDSEAMCVGDRMYFVTSMSNQEWLLYFDARHGEARGTGGAWIGKIIDPEDVIEAIL